MTWPRACLSPLVFLALACFLWASPARAQEQGASFQRYLPEPPQKLTFCGQPVPLDDPDVYERLDREFQISVHDQAQVMMWMKRAARYFPHAQAELKKAGLPDDLKYVAVAESALLHRISSPAGASGPWQFIRATARRYGLTIDQWVDQRRNFQMSTGAALSYLRDLHDEFGNWPLALAGYNAGERRVQQAIEDQGVNDYYNLSLPYETERYVFRILAAKIVLSNPAAYGYRVRPERLYQPRPVEPVRLSLGYPTHLRALAQTAGTTVRMLKELNPELRTYVLPSGDHLLQVPPGAAAKLGGYHAQPDAQAAAQAQKEARNNQDEGDGGRKDKSRSYVVRKGDHLGGICRQFGVSLSELRKANRLGNSSVIKPGQKLIIP